MPPLLSGALPILAVAVGVTFAIMGASLPREPRPRDRLVTLLMMAAASGLACIAASLLAVPTVLGQAGFLVVLFFAVAVQSRGPRWIAIGLAAVVNFYLVLFLKADLAHLPPALAALPVSIAVTALVGFVLVPERPVPAVVRLIRAIEHQGAVLVRGCEAVAQQHDPAERLRLRRRFGLLNEAILSAEDQLAVVDRRAAEVVSNALVRFELALIDLSAAAMAADALSERERVRLRLSARRLATGRRAALRARDGAATPVLSALADLDDAATRLAGESAAALAGLGTAPAVPPPPGPAAGAVPEARPAARPGLAWRPATRATAAAALSIVGGQLISPDRWFWAVLTAYLVFLGARSSGDTIHRGVLRVWGTVVGLVAGVLVAGAVAGHPVLEAAGLLACVFGLAYVFAISQTLAIFCVTVMLGLVYGLVGVEPEGILVLRLEETAVGALAAVAVDRFVFRRPTHDHVRETGGQLLAALAIVVRLSAERLAGQDGPSPVARMRGADRLLRDLRLALRPLQASRALVWWARRPSELPAILVCMFWVRVLATASEAARPAARPPGDAPTRTARLADRLDALARQEIVPADAPRDADAPAAPVEIGADHVGRGRTELLGMVLANLESVLDLLAERFGAEGWGALVARRRL